jgi:hypothetical protein
MARKAAWGAHKTPSRVRLPMSFGSVPDSAVPDRFLPRPRVRPPGGNGEESRAGAHKWSSCVRLATVGCSS